MEATSGEEIPRADSNGVLERLADSRLWETALDRLLRRLDVDEDVDCWLPVGAVGSLSRTKTVNMTTQRESYTTKGPQISNKRNRRWFESDQHSLASNGPFLLESWLLGNEN